MNLSCFRTGLESGGKYVDEMVKFNEDLTNDLYEKQAEVAKAIRELTRFAGSQLDFSPEAKVQVSLNIRSLCNNVGVDPSEWNEQPRPTK